MELYKSETREILRRYKERRITRGECTSALDAAATAVVPRLRSDQLQELLAAMKANEDALWDATGSAISYPAPDTSIP
jgi:hypothetical protein